jgi:prefoldin subunit 5
MPNLFSMLSQALARLGNKKPVMTVNQEDLEKALGNVNNRVDLLNARYELLNNKIEELNSVSTILLNVQQQIMEELMYPTSSTGKKSVVVLPPLGSGDDDDFLN